MSQRQHANNSQLLQWLQYHEGQKHWDTLRKYLRLKRTMFGRIHGWVHSHSAGTCQCFWNPTADFATGQEDWFQWESQRKAVEPLESHSDEMTNENLISWNNKSRMSQMTMKRMFAAFGLSEKWTFLLKVTQAWSWVACSVTDWVIFGIAWHGCSKKSKKQVCSDFYPWLHKILNTLLLNYKFLHIRVLLLLSHF
jgi:hypothetical protein